MSFLKKYSDTPKFIKYSFCLFVAAALVNGVVTIILTYFVTDLYHKPREIQLNPGEVDQKLLKPDEISRDAVVAHAYHCLSLTNGFAPDDIETRFEEAYPLMTPELARTTRIENEVLYEMVKEQNIHHNFRVVAFPKNGPIDIVEGAYWVVSFLGRLETTVGGKKGTEIIRDLPMTKVLDVYVERRESADMEKKGLFVNSMIHYSWDEYKELKEAQGEDNMYANFKGVIYREDGTRE